MRRAARGPRPRRALIPADAAQVDGTLEQMAVVLERVGFFRGRNRTQGFRRAISAHYASTTCSWEWKTQEFHGRHYRIVTGEHLGELGDGERNDAINPLDYAPHGSPLEDELGG